MRSYRVLRGLILVSVLTAAACGGTTDVPATPNTPTSPLPTISNLSAAFSNNGCIRSADGLAGRALVVTFNYTDTAGNPSGGRVQLARIYSTGRSETHFFAVPAEVTLTGTSTAGQIRIDNACPLYNDAVSSLETLTLIDASGFGSNALSTTVTRPAGAP